MATVTEDSGRGKGGKVKGKSKSRSSRAGLQGNYAEQVSAGADLKSQSPAAAGLDSSSLSQGQLCRARECWCRIYAERVGAGAV